MEVALAAAGLEPPGFVADFADLDPVKRYLDGGFDHRDLNDVVNFPPTSERLAHHLYDWCVDHLALPVGVSVDAVRVSETPSTWAQYRP